MLIPKAIKADDLRDAIYDRARKLGMLGWVQVTDAGDVQAHAEGRLRAVESLIAFMRSIPSAASAQVNDVRLEGHEQFAIRGLSAGAFVVQEHSATTHHFDLRLEVDGVMRSWALPRGPSMDPAVKRLAVQVQDHSLAHNDFEGATEGGGVIVWDRGTYEHGGRVQWPQALERGHAVFVLRGEKLHGGFALQRTRAGAKPQWLLVKRRDEQARPGSDVTAEQRASVVSGRTLAQLLGE